MKERGVAFGISLILLDSMILSFISSSLSSIMSALVTVFTGVGTNENLLLRLVTGSGPAGLDVVTTSSLGVSSAIFLGKLFLLRNLFLK